MKTATFIISCASLTFSCATFVIVVAAIKKAQTETKAARNKANLAVERARAFLSDLEV